MPFMKGPAPIRRTIKFLEQGKLFLNEGIKICTINYNTSKAQKHHEGAREFVFWHLAQLQYKNPDVQIVTFKNATPTPFLRFYYDTGDEMIVDVFGKKKDEIMGHLLKVVGKSEKVLSTEAQAKEKKENPANFGYECERHCICELPGQTPCPRLVRLPDHMRGKFIFRKDD